MYVMMMTLNFSSDKQKRDKEFLLVPDKSQSFVGIYFHPQVYFKYCTKEGMTQFDPCILV